VEVDKITTTFCLKKDLLFIGKNIFVFLNNLMPFLFPNNYRGKDLLKPVSG